MPTEKELEEQKAAEAVAEKEKKEAENDKDEDNDDDFINSLLNDDDDSDDDSDGEEDRSQKNRDAEEARKRRESEAKEKAELEEAKKKEEEESKKQEEEAQKQEEEAKRKAKQQEEEQQKLEETKAANQKKLGAQLVEFKKTHPDVDLGELEKDKNFKRFIDEKLLGKKDFSTLYDEYVDFRSETSGVARDIVEKNYRKLNSGSGSSQKGNSAIPSGLYSLDELRKIAKKVPYMSAEDYQKIEEKYEKSIEFHEK
jgi:hypothetical protein